MRERDPGSTRELEPSVGELVDSVVRKLVTAIVIAGALVGLGLWSRPGPARYQIVAADGRVFRINTKSGTVVGCEGDRCAIILGRHGQDLEDSLAPPPAPRPIAPPQAAPAPAPGPALPPPAAAAPAPATR